MLDNIKSDIAEAQAFIEDIVDKIEAQAEDLSEDSQVLWQQSKANVAIVKARLQKAAQYSVETSDAARLQVHLALMEANERWDTLQHTMTAFANQLEHKTEPVLSHAQLQAHLTRLEAADFFTGRGKEIINEFVASSKKVEQASLKAIQSFKNVIKK